MQQPTPASDPRSPIILPGQTMGEMTRRVSFIALRRRAGLGWWLAFLASCGLLALLIVSVLWLFYAGVGIWGIRWPVAWGFALIGYVWWIAIASGGTLVSALFFLVRVEWRTAITRIVETMMLFAAACAGIYPILHLGRPWFFYWLFPYNDTMRLWPQFRSPLLWDFFAILTYVLTSILFWFYSLIPDFATLRDQANTPFKRWFYGLLSFGWRGSVRHWSVFRTGYGAICAVMAPLVVSVHSIVGLDFAGGLLPGWHSTDFPPFFVFGAFLSGFATSVLMIVPIRHFNHLEAYITERHFDIMAQLILTSAVAIGYAYVMEAFEGFYGDTATQINFHEKMFGRNAPEYWMTVLFNVLLPQLFWFPRLRINRPVLLGVCALIIVGMWFERWIIVVASLERDHLPSSWHPFIPTFWDFATLFGEFGILVGGMLLFARLVPVLAMAELRPLILEKSRPSDAGS